MSGRHFQLRIELENDAMQSAMDVSRALEKVAAQLRERDPGTYRPIRDANGNTVGRWQFANDAREDSGD